MDAIILAGGLGTRLRPVLADVPKPLAPVGGRPFLDLLLKQLQGFGGIEKVVLAVGHKAEQIEAHYRNRGGFGFEIQLSTEEQPLGTGGALLQALPRTRSGDVLVLNGDSYVEFELDALIEVHRKRSASLTMVVVEVEDTARFGSVMLQGADQRVQRFIEKGGSHGRGFINAGCYLLARNRFERLSLGPASLEKDIIPTMLSSIHAYAVTGKFIDIGTPESYALAAQYLG